MQTERSRLGRDIAAAASALALLGALLVPKCPLCIAAWLAAVGVGFAGAPELGLGVRLGGSALAVLGLAATFSMARAQRRRECSRGLRRSSSARRRGFGDHGEGLALDSSSRREQ
jgi:hypothetical protein